MSVFLYSSCKSFTLITVLVWMWPALILNLIISATFLYHTNKIYDYVCHIILAVLSGIVCLVSTFGIVQNLIYIHDMSNTEVTYAVTSDEILAKVELNIDNSDWREIYTVDSPEMRNVKGEDIAVYHIRDIKSEANSSNTTEYIPGYAIQRKGELPQIITKRIYFDTSYINKKDALRTVRRKYPTVIIGNHKFDIDDDWNPYEVYEYRENIFSTDGNDYGLIILNLKDGTSEKYPVAENQIPSWVDFTTTYPR